MCHGSDIKNLISDEKPGTRDSVCDPELHRTLRLKYVVSRMSQLPVRPWSFSFGSPPPLDLARRRMRSEFFC
jgi:hypothetical protein